MRLVSSNSLLPIRARRRSGRYGHRRRAGQETSLNIPKVISDPFGPIYSPLRQKRPQGSSLEDPRGLLSSSGSDISIETGSKWEKPRRGDLFPRFHSDGALDRVGLLLSGCRPAGPGEPGAQGRVAGPMNPVAITEVASQAATLTAHCGKSVRREVHWKTPAGSSAPVGATYR